MEISLIGAMSKNWVIGKENAIPWSIPEEQRHFRELTKHKTVIMGRKTFESIGRVLPKRRTIIVTSNPKFNSQGCEGAKSIQEALALAKDEAEVFIAGGQTLYSATLPLAKRIYLTVIDFEIFGDTFFPQFNKLEFEIKNEQLVEGEPKYVYQTLERKLPPRKTL